MTQLSTTPTNESSEKPTERGILLEVLHNLKNIAIVYLAFQTDKAVKEVLNQKNKSDEEFLDELTKRVRNCIARLKPLFDMLKIDLPEGQEIRNLDNYIETLDRFHTAALITSGGLDRSYL